jgi:hypothetical protein
MALNTHKSAPSEKSSNSGTGGVSVFSYIERFLNLEAVVNSGLPEKHLFRILFVIVLAIVYIANTHMAERNVRVLNRTKSEVEDLRADYTTLKSELVVSLKQSEVARRVAELGLEESQSPPTKIKVSEDEY